jgi:CelD/BcsL family acetyltransferase involved in cellulose biosynthesis
MNSLLATTRRTPQGRVGAKLKSLDVVLYDNPERIGDLQAAWEILLRDIPNSSACQAFDFAMCGWEVLPKQPDTRLAVVTVWRGGDLVCVWPLYTARQGRLTVACHLGSGDFHEYAGPLVRDDDDAPDIVRAALKVIKGLADVVRVYNVRAPSRIVDTLAAEATAKRRSSIVCPVVSLIGIADWETRARTLSKKLRAQLRHDRRQLERLGALKFREMAGPHDAARCVAWIFNQKREWLAARKIRKSFMLDPVVRRFFEALSRRPARLDGKPYAVQYYAMTLDDRIIAACICLDSADRLEFHTTTFDPAFGDHAPGVLMIEDCVRLAISRGVDFDFRIARQDYKGRWSDREDRYDSFHFGCTGLGVVAIRIEAVQAWVRIQRVKYAPRIKALLRRGPSPGA